MKQLSFYFIWRPEVFLDLPCKKYSLSNGNEVYRSDDYPVWVVARSIDILGGYGICGRAYETLCFFSGTKAWRFAKVRSNSVISSVHH